VAVYSPCPYCEAFQNLWHVADWLKRKGPVAVTGVTGRYETLALRSFALSPDQFTTLKGRLEGDVYKRERNLMRKFEGETNRQTGT
jgi:hypothetical protein